jgi:hypothetical protein
MARGAIATVVAIDVELILTPLEAASNPLIVGYYESQLELVIVVGSLK